VTLRSEPSQKQDPRVRRSRTALFAAAVRLVTERQTTAISVSDLADAADMSRRVVYQQFQDRDTLLLEAALDLLRREHLDGSPTDDGDTPDSRAAKVLGLTAHFAQHQTFYRTMLTGTCAYAFNKELCGLFAHFNRQIVLQRHGPDLAPEIADDLTDFLTGGVAAIVHTWIVDGPAPLDPADLTARLARLLPLVTGSAD